jgi:membrane protease YdiL (CAAX protease family)
MAPKDRRAVLFFLSLTFGFTWSLNLFLFMSGGLNVGGLQIQMLIPAICAMLTITLVTKERVRDFGIRLGRIKYYAWAFLIPIAINGSAYLITHILGLAKLDPSMPGLAPLLANAPIPIEQLIPIILVQALFLGPLTGLPFTFGEEFGWRAFLLSKLLPLGRGRAIILHGVIWGVWHAPVIAMGYNYPGYPLIGPVLMAVSTIFLGTFLGWIYFASNSIVAPSLAHGAINQSASIFIFFMVGLNPITGGVTGIPGLLLWGLVALVLWRMRKLQIIEIPQV